MNITQIQDLIKFVAKSGVSEVEIEQKDFKITIKTPGKGKQEFVQVAAAPVMAAPAPVAMPAAAPAPAAAAPAPAAARPPHSAARGGRRGWGQAAPAPPPRRGTSPAAAAPAPWTLPD